MPVDGVVAMVDIMVDTLYLNFGSYWRREIAMESAFLI